MNILINLKNNVRFFMRRKLNCYLFSSKITLTLSIILFVYFVIMDIILIIKTKNRGPFHLSNIQNINLSHIEINQIRQKTIFYPLPVKKIMMADATHFIRSPIAELIEYEFNFSERLPFISANTISILHCVLSIISIKFLTHDLLFWRQFGVCIFQFRNFLDSFDGVLFRLLILF
jgi:hypothetical protein